jgi:hypothetical protein
MKTTVLSAAVVVFSMVSGFNAHAYDGSIDISDCPTVTLVIDDIDTAAGWGGHISTSSSSNGYGGSYAECHLTSSDYPDGDGSVTLLCYDGYLSASSHVDQYELHLGNRSKVKQVVLKVTNRGVFVEALKHSVSAYTSDENDYVVTGFFPLRETSSFCREDTLYYQADGVLAGTSSRDGAGYSMSVSVSP